MKKSILFSAALLAAGTAFAAKPAVAVKAQKVGADRQVVKMENVVKSTAMTPANLGKSTVVKSKKLANGSSIDLVRGADGMLHKVLNRGGLSLDNKAAAKKAGISVKSDESTSTLYEGFEGYAGLNVAGWVPEGWSQESKTEPAHAAPTDETSTCLVWTGIEDSYYTPAYSGECSEYIQVSIADYTTGASSEQQDEWLISPAFKVASGDYLSFYLYYSPAFTLLNSTTFDFTGENNILEVQVSTDNGATWDKIWDVLPHAKSFTEDELWDDAGSIVRNYYPMLVNLSNYVGKTIKLAFRYVGIDGESMMLDDITVGAVEPDAAVTAPDGVFPLGMSLEGYSLKYNYMLAPYNTALTWTNSSVLYENSSWSYPDPESTGDTETELTAETTNLEAPAYPYGAYSSPALVTSIGASQSEEAKLGDYTQYGGQVYASDGAGGYLFFDAALYNWDHVNAEKAEISYTNDIFGLGSDISTRWTSLFGSDVEITGMSFTVPAPAAPYTVSNLYVGIADASTLTDASTLYATLYKPNEDGQYEAIAKATCLPSEFLTKTNDGVAVTTADFQFTQMVDGMEVNEPVLIDDQIMVQISGDIADGEKALFYMVFDSDPVATTPTYMDYKVSGSDSEYSIQTTALTFADGSQATGFYAYLDVNYAWLNSDDDAFEAAPAGESKIFDVDSYYNLADSDGNLLDDITVEGDGLDEWYHLSYANATDDDAYAHITVTVDPLPEGTAIRSAYFDVNAYGFKKRFYVAQRSADGVNKVAAATSKAIVSGSNIVVESAKATSVAVYNVAGQKVAQKSFTGKATIPAADLMKGVYVLKFNDNTVVKLAK